MAYYMPWLSNAGGTEPYIWFPALDLNTIPFHVAAGAWGSHRPIQVADAPVTTGDAVIVNNATELQNAMLGTPGTKIRLAPGLFITGLFVNADNGIVRDIDVIIPPGTGLLGNFANGDRPRIGQYLGPDYMTVERLRFRGLYPGESGYSAGAFNGGQINNFNPFCDFSDLIFDGLQLSGPEGTNGSAAIDIGTDDQGRGGRRLAIHNCRANCGGGFMIGNTQDVVVCNNSILTAQGTTDPVDAWGFRTNGGGNHVFYGNDIRASEARAGTTNNVYHRLRFSPLPVVGAAQPSRYYWASNNTLVDRVQARILIVSAQIVDPPRGTLEGAWFQNNTVVAAMVVSGMEMSIVDAVYARIINNTIQSDIITSTANITLGAPVTNGDKTTGNVFQVLPGSDPAWGAVGDPSGIVWS